MKSPIVDHIELWDIERLVIYAGNLAYTQTNRSSNWLRASSGANSSARSPSTVSGLSSPARRA